MRRISQLRTSLGVAVFLLHSFALVAETFLGVDVERIERVVDLAYNLDERAEGEIERMAADFPESPVPDFVRAVRLYWLQNYAEIDDAAGERFEEVAVKALEKAKVYLSEDDTNLEAMFIVSMSELSLAKYYVEQQRWFSGFWKARSGLRGARRVLKRDPEFDDAKLALGMMNCFLSKAPGYIKPFALLMRFSGNMEKGLAYMEEAKAGLFTKVDASYYLAAIHWGLRKEAEEGYGELSRLVEAYPDNVEFQFRLAKNEFDTDRAKEAVLRLEGLLLNPKIEGFPFKKGSVAQILGQRYRAEGRADRLLEMARTLEAISGKGEKLEEFGALAFVFEGDALRAMGKEAEAYERYGKVEARFERLFGEASKRREAIDELKAGRE